MRLVAPVDQLASQAAAAIGHRLDVAFAEHADALVVNDKAKSAYRGVVLSPHEPAVLTKDHHERQAGVAVANYKAATTNCIHLSIAVDNPRGFGKRSRFGAGFLEDGTAFWLMPQVSAANIIQAPTHSNITNEL